MKHVRKTFRDVPAGANRDLAGALSRDQRGVTGLETAIILIAFVVVASVFAFTVLSTGIFSSERGKETVFAGLQEARGTMEPKGGVIANGLTKENLSLGNSAWTGETNVTATADTTDNKEGTGSSDLLVAAAFTTGLLASEDLGAAVDLTDQTQASYWIKSSTTTVAGQIELVLDETAGCGSPETQIDVPALTADTWQLVTVAIVDSSGDAVTDANKDAVACVGLELETTFSTNDVTINIDEVVGSGQVTSVVMNLTNAVEGEPVNVTPPSDSDDNGIADSDGNHVMVISYSDPNQLIRDVYWGTAFLGNNDSDDLLETGERLELTVYLKGLAGATPLVVDTEFTLEIKPPSGSVVVIKRRIPAVVDTVMALN